MKYSRIVICFIILSLLACFIAGCNFNLNVSGNDANSSSPSSFCYVSTGNGETFSDIFNSDTESQSGSGETSSSDTQSVSSSSSQETGFNSSVESSEQSSSNSSDATSATVSTNVNNGGANSDSGYGDIIG